MARRKISRSLRQAAKSLRVASAATKSALKAGELGGAAGQVVDKRIKMLRDTVSAPLSALNPEFLQMGVEKGLAAASVGSSMLSNFAAFQRAYLNFSLANLRLAQTMTGALMRARSPLAVAVAIGETVQAAAVNSVDTILSAAQLGQTAVGGALKPLHRAATANAQRLSRQ